jgi:hypothetical protein
MDEFCIMITIDLISEVTDIDIYHIGKGVEVDVPDMLGNHGAGHYAAYIPHEVFQQGIFFNA